MTARRIHAYILLLIVALIWGFASVVIKFTLEGIEPFPFLTYRFLISAVIGIFALLSVKQKFSVLIRNAPAIIIYGLLSTTGALGFLFLGLARSSVLELALITLLGPLLIQIAGVLFLHEHITKQEKIGTTIAIAGTLFTIIEPLLAGSNGSDFIGNIFLVLYITFDIGSLVIMKKLLRSKVDPGALTNIGFIVGFISALGITLFAYPLSELINTAITLPLKYQLGVWYMALFSGTIAYILRAKGQKTIEVGEGALFGYLTPLFSAPLAVLFLAEKTTPLFVLGAIVIAVGVIIAEYKPKRS